MSDLIDRQAAIEAIKQMQMPIMRSEFPEEQFVFTGMSEALQAIKDLPSAQPERKTGRWIPCSERLPEYDGEMYLVTDYCEPLNRTRIHVSYCYVNQDGFWSDVPVGYTVIAWMPLPEPYKGEDGGGA